MKRFWAGKVPSTSPFIGYNEFFLLALIKYQCFMFFTLNDYLFIQNNNNNNNDSNNNNNNINNNNNKNNNNNN